MYFAGLTIEISVEAESVKLLVKVDPLVLGPGAVVEPLDDPTNKGSSLFT